MIVQVEEDMPLQTYLIKYQKLLQEEAEIKFGQLLEDESLHISQVISDVEISWAKSLDKQTIDITERLAVEQIHISNKLNDQATNTEKIERRVTGAELNLTKKLHDANMQISHKLDDQFSNISQLLFEGIQIIKNAEINISRSLDDKILIMKQESLNSEISLAEKLEEHIANVSLVTEALGQRVSDCQITFSKMLVDMEMKLTEVFSNEIRNQKEKCMDADLHLTKKIEKLIHNISQETTYLEGEIINLKQEFEDVQYNMSKKIDNEVLNLTHIIMNSEINVTENLREHIRNATLVAEQMDEAILESKLNFSKKLDNLEIKITTNLKAVMTNITEEMNRLVSINKY